MPPFFFPREQNAGKSEQNKTGKIMAGMACGNGMDASGTVKKSSGLIIQRYGGLLTLLNLAEVFQLIQGIDITGICGKKNRCF